MTSPRESPRAGVSIFPTQRWRWATRSEATLTEPPEPPEPSEPAEPAEPSEPSEPFEPVNYDPPVSDSTTNGIRVQVTSRYLPERSTPSEKQFWFAYHIRVSNLGDETA